MSAYNPYAAPQVQNAYPHGSAAYAQPWQGQQYVPLGWRTGVAAACIVAVVVAKLGMEGSLVAMDDDPGLGTAAVAGLSALAVLGTLVLAAIFFGIWIHRASANLRGLRRDGLNFSPGGCVGWFYVPFANLVQPVRAMSEIWRASEPGGDGYEWTRARGTPWLGIWWGTWLLGNIVGEVSALSGNEASSGAAIGLVGAVLTAVAGMALIVSMLGISRRQQQAAASSVQA